MSKNTRASSYLSFFRDDFQMESWLLAGASIQALAFLVIGRSALLLIVALVLAQVGVYALKETGLIDPGSRKGVYWGKWSTKIPHKDGTPSNGPGEESITVFVLSARSNHPRGRFAPGFVDIGEYFGAMWRSCIKNRETNGFLGKTSTLIGTEQDCNNQMTWLSYWKSIDDLQAFANSSVHTKGLRWYNDVALKKYPDIGIMHETYNVPKGHWESIMLNSKPWGLAATKHYATDKANSNRKEIDIITKAEKGQEWYKMKDRMGKPAAAA